MATELEAAIEIFGLTYGRTRPFGVSYAVSIAGDPIAWFKAGRGNNGYQRGTYSVKLPSGFGDLTKLEQVNVIENQIVPKGADNTFVERPAVLRDSDVESDCPKGEKWHQTLQRLQRLHDFRLQRKQIACADC